MPYYKNGVEVDAETVLIDAPLGELIPHPALPALIAILLGLALLPLICVCVRQRMKARQLHLEDKLTAGGSAAEAAKARIARAQAAAQHLRLTVSGSLAALGFLAVGVAFGALLLKAFAFWPATYYYDSDGNEYLSEWRLPFSSFTAFIAPGMSMMLLSLTPADRVLVQIMAVVLFIAISIFTLMFGALPVAFATEDNHIRRGPSYQAYNIIVFGCSSFTMAMAALLSAPTLCCDGCDGCFQMGTRHKLGRLWLSLRIFFVAFGSMFLLAFLAPLGVAYFLDERQAGSATRLLFAVGALMCVLCAAVLRPSLRRVVHRRLGNLSLQGESRSAAAIAALVGGRDSAAALQHGIKSFRALPFSKLEEVDLQTNHSTASPQSLGLYERTQVATLGSVDAFLSHSWHDAPSAKWNTLTTWASALPAPPLLWLDKYTPFCRSNPRRHLFQFPNLSDLLSTDSLLRPTLPGRASTSSGSTSRWLPSRCICLGARSCSCSWDQPIAADSGA